MYINTLSTVKGEIQQAENPTTAEVIITEAARVDNFTLLDYLTSEVAIEEPGIGSTDPNHPADINCKEHELHFRMPGGCEDYHDDREEIDERNAIPTASQRRRAATELERFDLGTSDIAGDEGNDGDNADQEEETSQASVGNGYKFPGRCRVRFQPGSEPL